MTKIVAIVNQKGGVGKTTTAVNLAAGLALFDQRVLLIDFDPQGNATSGLNVDKNEVRDTIYSAMAGQVTLEEVIQETELPLLKLIPANRNLAAAEVELVNEVGREFVLKQLLEAKPLPFDLILIDCPPSLSLLTINALAAAHSILIPIQAEYYALEGVSDLFKTVELVKKRINPTLAIEGVLLTMYSERTNLSNQVMEELTGHFKNRLYKSIIPRNVRLSEAPSFGKPVITYDVRSKGAQAYLQLAKEFIHGQA